MQFDEVSFDASGTSVLTLVRGAPVNLNAGSIAVQHPVGRYAGLAGPRSAILFPNGGRAFIRFQNLSKWLIVKIWRLRAISRSCDSVDRRITQ
jgi:hypothetical protein